VEKQKPAVPGYRTGRLKMHLHNEKFLTVVLSLRLVFSF